MMISYLLALFYGTLITLKVAFFSALLGSIIGMLGAISESLTMRWLRWLLNSVFFVIRGLPELLVLFFIYFGMTSILSFLFGAYTSFDSYPAAVIALSLIFGAYASQIYRAAFFAVEKGQIESAKALGFNQITTFMRIQLPQIWRHALPGIGNLWLVLLKDTAIVMLIGLPDLMARTKMIASITLEPFTFYLIAAFIYLMITSFSQKCINIINEKANRYLV